MQASHAPLHVQSSLCSWFTIAERKRAQSIPDGVQVFGSLAQKAQQVGGWAPPECLNLLQRVTTHSWLRPLPAAFPVCLHLPGALVSVQPGSGQTFCWCRQCGALAAGQGGGRLSVCCSHRAATSQHSAAAQGLYGAGPQRRHHPTGGSGSRRGRRCGCGGRRVGAPSCTSGNARASTAASSSPQQRRCVAGCAGTAGGAGQGGRG
jgi:hypothetical protein